jgi:Flp pilus assembly protein TadG
MALLRRLCRDNSGNVAGAFALSVFPVIGLAGAAVD